MKRAANIEIVKSAKVGSNARKNIQYRTPPPPISVSNRRLKTALKNICEHYQIEIKPKLFRSSSLSDLTNPSSDFSLDYFKETQYMIHKYTQQRFDISGDTQVDKSNKHTKQNQLHMSRNFKGIKSRKKTDAAGKPQMSPEAIACKFADKYANQMNSGMYDSNVSAAESSSVSSVGFQGGITFPFKSTPSGNFKVQSNQVVFQSSTVGVILADPSQAKVKVKFEGNGHRDTEDDGTHQSEDILCQKPESEGQHTPSNHSVSMMYAEADFRTQNLLEDKCKNLATLGYDNAEPIDWMRIQLPKKQDVMQDLYRRIHSYMNTDTVVHIGDEEFHCHHVVLEVYSSFFDTNLHREIELPLESVTPEAFHIIYEWMIFNGPESNKALKRDNVLEVFCAAQFLAIKDLEEQCWSFIMNENIFSEDTAFTLFREARLKGLTPVIDLMVPRVMRFFLPLVASKDFLELEPEEVLTFLRSNYICVTSEIEVLMAGIRWLYGAWSTRQRHCVAVMRCVRFGLISPWQLVDIRRNPDNGEILDIVNLPDVQQMVDDGLAYVIIKYWYGNNSKNYYHWIDVLGLSEPAERNWIGEEKNHVTYKEFLKYLEQFMIPKDQMYQFMAMLPPTRRNEEIPPVINWRGMDNDHTNTDSPGKRKFDFPLPATLSALSRSADKPLPTMSEFLEDRERAREGPGATDASLSSPSPRDTSTVHQQQMCSINGGQRPERRRDKEAPQKPITKHQDIHLVTIETPPAFKQGPSQALAHHYKQETFNDLPERDFTEVGTSQSETDTAFVKSSDERIQYNKEERRHSVAANYLAAATAALSGNTQRSSQNPVSCLSSPTRVSVGAAALRSEDTSKTCNSKLDTPQISLFRQSKEAVAKMNMNKLSMSILGPSNKNYITDGSLFNWDRETVLVFGGIDPHTAYGQGKNTGKDIHRFDPVTNVWEYVGDLPEPRHHHSVAFLKGRVYLVGGADPRDDDIRGKSVVVSTVWSFEPVTRSWYSESGLAVPRKNFGLVVHRMALYAIGGQDKKGRVLRSVEKFDPRTGSWTEVRPMAVARMAVAATKYRDYIWVAGGMTGEKRRPLCRRVECYNSNTNEWTEIYSLRFPRCFATLFSMNNNLYLVGGAGRLSDKEKSASSLGAIDVWDWQTREWTLRTEMSIPRHGHALAYLGTQLIIIGGVTTIYMRALNNVESFCCDRGAWIRGVSALPAPMSGHGAVTLPPASLM